MSEAGKPTVGIFIFDGVEVLDFGGPFEVFSGASEIGWGQSLFHVVTIAEEDRTITCAGGSASCVDSGASIQNGTSCGTDMVCSAGTCVACARPPSSSPRPATAR